MKKGLTILTTAGTYLTLTSRAFASSINVCPPSPFDVLCDQGANLSIIQKIISLLFVLAVAIAVIYLIWGGIKWIMSGGDKGSLESARQHVIAAIIGLVVVFLTYFIINFVMGYFGITAIPSSDNQGVFSF